MKFTDTFTTNAIPDNNVTPIRLPEEGKSENIHVPKTAFKKTTEKYLQALCASTGKPRREMIEEAIGAYYYGNGDMRNVLVDAIDAMRDITASANDDNRLFAQVRVLNHVALTVLSSREDIEVKTQIDLKKVKSLDGEYGPSYPSGPVSQSVIDYMAGRVHATQEILEEIKDLIRNLADKGEPL